MQLANLVQCAVIALGLGGMFDMRAPSLQRPSRLSFVEGEIVMSAGNALAPLMQDGVEHFGRGMSVLCQP